MRSSKKISALVLAAVAAGLSLTACNPSEGSNDAGAGPEPSAIASQGGSAATGGDDGDDAASGSGSVPGSGSGSGSGSACTTDGLGFSTAHGMGEGQLVVNMKNTGSATCTMKGYPGADLKGEYGTVSAKRSTDRPVRQVSLAPGEQTTFLISYPVNDSGGSGVSFTRLSVTPPNETHTADLAVDLNIPADDSSSPIEVDPVGAYK